MIEAITLWLTRSRFRRFGPARVRRRRVRRGLTDSGLHEVAPPDRRGICADLPPPMCGCL